MDNTVIRVGYTGNHGSKFSSSGCSANEGARQQLRVV